VGISGTLTIIPSDGQTFPNPVREELPTIRLELAFSFHNLVF
jgi:hypothetical protein